MTTMYGLSKIGPHKERKGYSFPLTNIAMPLMLPLCGKLHAVFQTILRSAEISFLFAFSTRYLCENHEDESSVPPKPKLSSRFNIVGHLPYLPSG